MRRLLLLPLLLLLLPACVLLLAPLPESFEGYACNDGDDCGAGLDCVDSVCVRGEGEGEEGEGEEGEGEEGEGEEGEGEGEGEEGEGEGEGECVPDVCGANVCGVFGNGCGGGLVCECGSGEECGFLEAERCANLRDLAYVGVNPEREGNVFVFDGLERAPAGAETWAAMTTDGDRVWAVTADSVLVDAGPWPTLAATPTTLTLRDQAPPAGDFTIRPSLAVGSNLAIVAHANSTGLGELTVHVLSTGDEHVMAAPGFGSAGLIGGSALVNAQGFATVGAASGARLFSHQNPTSLAPVSGGEGEGEGETFPVITHITLSQVTPGQMAIGPNLAFFFFARADTSTDIRALSTSELAAAVGSDTPIASGSSLLLNETARVGDVAAFDDGVAYVTLDELTGEPDGVHTVGGGLVTERILSIDSAESQLLRMAPHNGGLLLLVEHIATGDRFIFRLRPL